jgi:long-chain acyl-CoA synthetase
MDESNYASIGWTVARLARQAEIALAGVDLTSAQYRMLVQIARGTEASSALAEKLAVSAPSVTAVVEGLVQRGAVFRTHSIEDRRRNALALTESGRVLLAGAEDVLRERLVSIASEMEDPTLVADAIGALHVWGEALDRARVRRHALRADTTGESG